MWLLLTLIHWYTIKEEEQPTALVSSWRWLGSPCPSVSHLLASVSVAVKLMGLIIVVVSPEAKNGKEGMLEVSGTNNSFEKVRLILHCFFVTQVLESFTEVIIIKKGKREFDFCYIHHVVKMRTLLLEGESKVQIGERGSCRTNSLTRLSTQQSSCICSFCREMKTWLPEALRMQ